MDGVEVVILKKKTLHKPQYGNDCGLVKRGLVEVCPS